MKRRRAFALSSLMAVLLTAPRASPTAGLGEWEMRSPGGHFIVNSDVYEHKPVLRTPEGEVVLTRVTQAAAYLDQDGLCYLAGHSDRGWFLYKEADRRPTFYLTREHLTEAIQEGKLRKTRFTDGDDLTPWLLVAVIYYSPMVFFGLLAFGGWYFLLKRSP
jgi:hypothetical protein